MLLLKYTERIERLTLKALIVLMALVVLLSTLELAYLILTDILTQPVLLLEVNELLDIFGFFFMVLIGIELLETIKTYFKEDSIHVEVVVTVSIIAVARKVIILDIKELPSLTVIGLGLVILALCIGYYFLKKARIIPSKPDTASPGETP